MQNVLDGKKKSKYKYSLQNETYPLRGHLICSKCGKILTASSAKGNGGKYYYYHCVKGCKERFKSDTLNQSFVSWLTNITLPFEFVDYYLKMIEDTFKLHQGDNNVEIKKIESHIESNKKLVTNTDMMMAKGELSPENYCRIISNLNMEAVKLKDKLSEHKNTITGFQEYTSYGINLLSNLDKYYSTVNIDDKQKMIGLIFPERLLFSENDFQTNGENEILTLLCSNNKGFKGNKKGLPTNKSKKSYGVTPSGFKPETF